MKPTAIYVHIPFCPSKCGYCDFNSYAMEGEIVSRTVKAIEAEIRSSPWAGVPAKTIFFGGGTPTFLSSKQLCGLLQAVIEAHPPVADCEITSEANPGTVDSSKFVAMREAGFNRVSLGAQSFLSSDLIRLDRIHGPADIEIAVNRARAAGFSQVNLDLMFALPGQSRRAWKNNLKMAINLNPDHLSLYCLTLEENTKFYKLHQKGMLEVPKEESQVAMYDIAQEYAENAGYHCYEISNFARRDSICQHNLCYWRGENYAGYGPGAVGTMDGKNLTDFDKDAATVRYTNWKHPLAYCEAVESGRMIAFEHEEISPQVARLERILLGIRLTEGIDLGLGLLEPGLQNCLDNNWVEINGETCRLTPSGRHFCSEVALALA